MPLGNRSPFSGGSNSTDTTTTSTDTGDSSDSDSIDTSETPSPDTSFGGVPDHITDNDPTTGPGPQTAGGPGSTGQPQSADRDSANQPDTDTDTNTDTGATPDTTGSMQPSDRYAVPDEGSFTPDSNQDGTTSISEVRDTTGTRTPQTQTPDFMQPDQQQQSSGINYLTGGVLGPSAEQFVNSLNRGYTDVIQDTTEAVVPDATPGEEVVETGVQSFGQVLNPASYVKTGETILEVGSNAAQATVSGQGSQVAEDAVEYGQYAVQSTITAFQKRPAKTTAAVAGGLLGGYAAGSTFTRALPGDRSTSLRAEVDPRRGLTASAIRGAKDRISTPSLPDRPGPAVSIERDPDSGLVTLDPEVRQTVKDAMTAQNTADADTDDAPTVTGARNPGGTPVSTDRGEPSLPEALQNLVKNPDQSDRTPTTTVDTDGDTDTTTTTVSGARNPGGRPVPTDMRRRSTSTTTVTGARNPGGTPVPTSLGERGFVDRIVDMKPTPSESVPGARNPLGSPISTDVGEASLTERLTTGDTVDLGRPTPTDRGETSVSERLQGTLTTPNQVDLGRPTPTDLDTPGLTEIGDYTLRVGDSRPSRMNEGTPASEFEDVPEMTIIGDRDTPSGTPGGQDGTVGGGERITETGGREQTAVAATRSDPDASADADATADVDRSGTPGPGPNAFDVGFAGSVTFDDLTQRPGEQTPVGGPSQPGGRPTSQTPPSTQPLGTTQLGATTGPQLPVEVGGPTETQGPTDKTGPEDPPRIEDPTTPEDPILPTNPTDTDQTDDTETDQPMLAAVDTASDQDTEQDQRGRSDADTDTDFDRLLESGVQADRGGRGGQDGLGEGVKIDYLNPLRGGR